MGKKINPRIFRQPTTFKSPSRWFAASNVYAATLKNDVLVRKYLKKKFRDAGVARIEIERDASTSITIVIFTSKPGVVIGRGGAFIEETKKELKKLFFGSQKIQITMNIQEVREPDLSAELIYQSIRDQLEARVPFRRALKRAVEQVMRGGAQGVRIQISGRLNGADIARSETATKGRLPLHTLRANIDYTRGVAMTIYGIIGVKVWVYTGDIFSDEELEATEQKRAAAPSRSRARAPRRNLSGSGSAASGDKTTILRKKADIEKEKAVKSEPIAQ